MSGDGLQRIQDKLDRNSREAGMEKEVWSVEISVEQVKNGAGMIKVGSTTEMGVLVSRWEIG